MTSHILRRYSWFKVKKFLAYYFKRLSVIHIVAWHAPALVLTARRKLLAGHFEADWQEKKEEGGRMEKPNQEGHAILY
jgi:hypothetical protein